MKNYSPKLQHKMNDFLMKSKNSVANDEASGCTKSECDQHTEQSEKKCKQKIKHSPKRQRRDDKNKYSALKSSLFQSSFKCTENKNFLRPEQELFLLVSK